MIQESKQSELPEPPNGTTVLIEHDTDSMTTHTRKDEKVDTNMTKYFYDTEFIENGSTIDLISIGIVADDGREYYAVNHDMPIDRISKNACLVKNVVPSLPLYRPKIGLEDLGKALVGALSFKLDQSSSYVKPGWVITNEVREFLLAGAANPELWAYYSAYDHVVLAQLFGPMVELPEGIPMYTNDIMQEAARQGRAGQLPKQENSLHNALQDARHVKSMHDWLQETLVMTSRTWPEPPRGTTVAVDYAGYRTYATRSVDPDQPDEPGSHWWKENDMKTDWETLAANAGTVHIVHLEELKPNE